MCTYYSFSFALAPAGLIALILFSYSEQGLIFSKEFVLNKNIVHLIDEIFWNLGFKHEPQSEMVIPIIRTYYTYYTLYVHYTDYINYTHYCRFVKNLDLRTTCGRTNGTP